MIKLENLPLVTIEAIIHFREAALTVQRQRDDLLVALESAVLLCKEQHDKEEFAKQFQTLIDSIMG